MIYSSEQLCRNSWKQIDHGTLFSLWWSCFILILKQRVTCRWVTYRTFCLWLILKPKLSCTFPFSLKSEWLSGVTEMPAAEPWLTHWPRTPSPGAFSSLLIIHWQAHMVRISFSVRNLKDTYIHTSLLFHSANSLNKKPCVLIYTFAEALPN